MQALTIGSLARQQVQRAQIATLIGQSSHGLYLRLETAWVIFLSWDNSPGPLTIQLACALPEKLASGTRLKIAPDSLVFPPPVGRLNLRIAEVWQAPPARLGPAGLLPPLERAARLAEMAQLAVSLRPGAGWSALLPGADAQVQELTGLPLALRPALFDLGTALRRGNGPAAADVMVQLLGLGAGLTPSGDDLAVGLLLAVSRWGAELLLGLDRRAFIHQAVERARQATSDLSASLIECAALGQADPRLIAALDSLVIGRPAVADCAAGLAAWGHSSGLDALLGMSLVI